MVSIKTELSRRVSITLVVLTCLAIAACGGGGGTGPTAIEPAGLAPIADAPAAVPADGFNLSGPGALFDLIEPGRDVSTVKGALEYEATMPVSQATPSGANLHLDPHWSPGAEPPLLDLAYAFYSFNIADYTGPGSLTLGWSIAPIFSYDVWVGFGNRQTSAWDWHSCATSYTISLDEVDPYSDVGGDVLVAVLMTGTFDAFLTTVDFIAGDSEPPVADLVIAANGGSVNGPVTLDASGSTDPDGTIDNYEWDFDGVGSYDQSGSAATVDHTFAATGQRDVTVRVTDNTGGNDTATVSINVYDEAEDNDDGSYSSSTFTTADLNAANTLPALDFSGFVGNCGNGGFGDDQEDFFEVDIPAAGWYTFLLYFIDDEANLDMTLIEDIGGGGAELDDSTTSTDNEEIVWEFTNQGTYYIQVYTYVSSEETDYTLEIKAGSFIMPDASFTATPDEGDPPLNVSFDASASSDSDGSIVLYEWDFDGDGTYDESSANPTTSHEFTEPGGFHVMLRVTDDTDLTDTATRTIVVFGAPPVADLQATPSSGTVPVTVTFDASGSTPTGGIESYRFDWNNDGTYDDTYSDPVHVLEFYGDGTFTIGLQVEDYQDQTDETTVTVTVSPGTYSETEVNDTYQESDILPALDFTGWTGVVGPVETTETDPADPEDWSSFSIPGSGEVRIYMVLTDRLGDIDIKLFDSDGTTQLALKDGIGDDEEIIYYFAAGGTYYIEVYMWDSTSNRDWRGGYDFEVSFTAD